MTTTLRINGTDVGTTFGWYPDALPGWLTAPPRRLQSSTMYGRSGVVVTWSDLAGARTFGIQGTLSSTTVALRRAAEAGINDLCYGGLVRITVEDGLTAPRSIEGLCTSLKISPFGASMAPIVSRIDAEFTCPDPVWFEQEWTSRVIGATRATVALGTAPSTPIIRLMGAATTPTVTYRDAGGTAVKTLSTGISLTASEDWLDIDCRTGLVTLYDNTVISNALPSVNNSIGDFPWALDPQDGDYTTSAWPTVEVSSGAGIVYWRKAYL